MLSKIVKMTVTLCILSVFGWGYMTWQKFLSDTEVLRDKDVEEYELMRKKLSGFSFKEGFKIYDHLKNTSKAEFIEMRFREFRNQWYEDTTFRKAEQTKEKHYREQLKKEKELEYEAKSEELRPLGEKDRAKALFIRWESTPSWQKALLLREKCNKYLRLEKQNSNRRKNIHNLPAIVTLLNSSGKGQLSIAELCEEMALAGANDQEIEKTLLNLREQMNYYFFMDLLRDVGVVPSESIYPPDYRLKRMATDFINYN